MTDILVDMISDIPHWLGVIIMSMIPVGELRLSIPVAITSYGMNPVYAYVLSCIGNMIPVPFIILFIRPVFVWMKKFRIFKSIVEKIESKGLSKQKNVLKYKFWGLFILVAIPLPGTGAWTGALVAALMDLRFKKCIPAITLGVMAAGILVTLATTGVLKIIGL